MMNIDQNGLEAAVRECARITAPGVTDEEFERERAEGSSRYLKTREEMSRMIGAYLAAQQREPVVRVKMLQWVSEPPFSVARVWGGQYEIERVGGNVELRGDLLCQDFDSIEAAKSAAQADYEQRIMAAIEIAPQSDRQPLPGQKQISETGKELPENAEQPMNNADVSVGELAGFFVTEFPHLLTVSTQIEVARALLARYRIERLDRLASSGRR